MGRGGQEGDAAYGPGEGGAGGTGVPRAACALLPGAAATVCDATGIKPGVLGLVTRGRAWRQGDGWQGGWWIGGLGGVAVRRVVGFPSRGGLNPGSDPERS